MDKEGKVFFVQRKCVKEVPYLLSLVSDEPIPCHTWVRETKLLRHLYDAVDYLETYSASEIFHIHYE